MYTKVKKIINQRLIIFSMKVKKLKNFKSGQMLIESLFALSVIAVVLIALMIIAVISIKNARYSRNMILANHYVQQAVENTRAYRNKNGFNALIGNCSGSPCCYEEITPSALDIINCNSDGGLIQSTIFQRRIEINDEGETDRKKVIAEIFWSDSNCGSDNLCKVEIVTYLSQWEN